MCEILGVFVNTFTADDKCPVQDLAICLSRFKGNYLNNEKLFLDFLLHF